MSFLTKPLVTATISAATLSYASQSYAGASEYIIDNAHTHIVWKVDRFGFTNTVGSFADIHGTVTLDKDAPENSHVEAKISLSGLRSDLLEREEIIRGKFWLDADNHPSIDFQSTSVELIDGDGCELGCADVTGHMTLKGVTAPLTFRVSLNKIGPEPVTRSEAVGFSAKGHFDRSEFGVETALGLVGTDVSFEIEVLAVDNSHS